MSNILEIANDIVNNRSEEKDRKYGPFTEGMERTATIASILGNKHISTKDAFNVLIGLKLSREGYNHKEDNLLDAAAYIGGLNNMFNETQPIIRSIDKNRKFKLYQDLHEFGEIISPRGEMTKELTNYVFEIDPYDRFFSFKGRNSNINYIKKELMWYFSANSNNVSIIREAKIWNDIYEADGRINSNYGAIIFNDNFDRVLNALIDDQYTRKAIISIATNKPFNDKDMDTPCTMSMVFSIRKNKLNLSVYMRSNDAIFGLCNDVPFFTIVQEMMYVCLKDKYPDLKMGIYRHSADSLHIYKRHFKALEAILTEATEETVFWPKFENSSEVRDTLTYFKRKDIDFRTKYVDWLETPL